jgi:hypothetical protein
MNIANCLTVAQTIRSASIGRTSQSLTVNAVSTANQATGPRCQMPARRVQSHYRRLAGALPWQGVA